MAEAFFAPRFSRAEFYGLAVLFAAIAEGADRIVALLLFFLWVFAAKIARIRYG